MMRLRSTGKKNIYEISFVPEKSSAYLCLTSFGFFYSYDNNFHPNRKYMFYSNPQAFFLNTGYFICIIILQFNLKLKG